MKLVDIFNTKYFTNDYAEDIQFLMENTFNPNAPLDERMWDKGLYNAILEFRKEGRVDIDLADARFTEKVWDMFEKYLSAKPDLIKIYDSQDKLRGDFIDTLCRELTQSMPEQIMFPPFPQNVKEMPKYCQELSRDAVYSAAYVGYDPSIIILIQLLAPDVKLYIDANKLFDYFKSIAYDLVYSDCKEFLYCTLRHKSSNFWTTEVTDDNMVYIVNLGYIPKSAFIGQYSCVPAILATGERKNSPEWREVFRRILADVQDFLHNQSRTLYKILEES